MLPARLSERLSSGPPSFSFEFFPPPTAEAEAELWLAIDELTVLQPTFVSVTCGAGGSKRDKTLELALQLPRRSGLRPVAHLVCRGSKEEEVASTVQRLIAGGVHDVLALRGDAPRDADEPAGDFKYASELVRYLRTRQPGLCIGAASYPEGHLEASTREADLLHLKEKVLAGSDFLITQIFFDNAFYFDFVHRARAIGITVPIIPGIMPITNASQLERFIQLCGATVPQRLRMAISQHAQDRVAIAQLGIAHATAQCADLLARGAPGIHFYTLNRSRATRAILMALKGR